MDNAEVICPVEIPITAEHPYPTTTLITTDNKITAGPVADRIRTISERWDIWSSGMLLDHNGERVDCVPTYLCNSVNTYPGCTLFCFLFIWCTISIHPFPAPAFPSLQVTWMLWPFTTILSPFSTGQKTLFKPTRVAVRKVGLQ